MRQVKKISSYISFLGEDVKDFCIQNDFEVDKITSDSRQASEKSVFCAVKGVKCDGNDFIDNALTGGASAVLSMEKHDECKNFIQVFDDRMAYSEMQRFFYGEPDCSLKLIGVTGTNGKTTSVYLFYNLLRELQKKTAFFTTINNYDGKKWQDSDCTTPDAGVLFEFMARARHEMAEFLAMECSSHALSQKRLGKSRFQVVLFTNLTGDHLDYYGTMTNYFEAKKELFLQHTVNDGTAVVNIDDEYGRKLVGDLKENKINVTTFGFAEDADFKMTEIKTEFFINGSKLQSSLFGRHNFYNITGVVAALASLGFEFEKCLEILRDKNISIPGRLEKIELGSHGTAFVDYAHTDDALKQVLEILRQESCRRKGRLICVFGCGGDRDRSKRSRMGRVVSELADEFIVTSDNPRHEKAEDIINEILAGSVKKPFCIDPDRRSAIRTAVEFASGNDIILVAGKGHEKNQQIGDVKMPFDDCEELKNAIMEREI
ncbi:MAG: UDP-N-acetylmuramoyl-L-alanyl-D-glutamate--2,6-diaminopimelate ligase [Lentisphaeria bacterium]|nr:UDP-N-acetylmuramoyl-L-alanyl-D-glutamate--2,6-diaminopimelate ligase [Lentisphaeria bacterium]